MLNYMVQRQLTNLTRKLGPQLANLDIKLSLKMSNTFNLRWAFKAKDWELTRDEILTLSSYVQIEEKERISKFIFKDDAKFALLGRLMLRKYIHLSTSIPYEEIRLTRDYYGKPHLVGTGDVHTFFNVSHQGDYVVLAGHKDRAIGIDVMKIEPPANKNIQEFFRLMNRQLTPPEWSKIRSFRTESEQIACFYRIWCIKESYVKSIGLGLSKPLHEVCVSMRTNKLKIGEITTDTTLNFSTDRDWLFEETLLDDKHTVAVCIENKNDADIQPAPFTYINFDELVKEAKPLYDPDNKFADEFMQKKQRPLNL